MIEFQRTDKVGLLRDSHYHVVYLNSKTGQGITSVDAGHQHTLQYQPAQPEQIGPDGQPIPGMEAGWIMQPAPDGHVHSLEPIRGKRSKKAGETDAENISRVLSLWQEASNEESESIEKGREAEDFYIGDQWEAAAKTRLKALDRACLTLNKIAPHIDTLSGYQREQRQDLHFVPTKGGKQRAADIMNHVAKNLLEQCHFAMEESEACLDQFIPGRGVLNMFIDFNQDLRGVVKVERYPWDEIRFGPHEKKDLSDCEYLVKSRMYSKEKVKQMFPDAAEDLDAAWQLLSTADPIEKPHTQHSSNQYALSDNRFPATMGGTSLYDISRKEVRILECWQRIYEKSRVLVDVDEDFYLNVTDWNPKDFQKAQTIPGVRALEKTLSRMRITKVGAGVVLSDQNPADLPVDDFFVFPIYANKRRNRFWGKVENAKDPQREINQRRSQTVDIGNKMVAYGWFYDETTFADDNERAKFLRISSSPGWQIKLQDLARQPVKVEGSKFPAELAELINIASQDIADAMNIIAEPEGANESGEHLLHKQRTKLRGNEYLFDNLKFAKVRLGRHLVRVIQRYYSPKRILGILQSDHETAEPIQLEGQDGQLKSLDQYSEEEILDILNDTDLTQVDVAVGESDYSPTMRLALFSVFTKLQQAGIQVPFETLIEFIDIPESQKQKILQQYAQQAEQQGAQQAETSKMEINKTLIAKGIIPPEIQADLQRQEQELAAQGQQVPPTDFNQIEQTEPSALSG